VTLPSHGRKRKAWARLACVINPLQPEWEEEICEKAIRVVPHVVVYGLKQMLQTTTIFSSSSSIQNKNKDNNLDFA
jgi:hypothetical protein